MSQFTSKLLLMLIFVMSTLLASAQHLYTKGVVIMRQDFELTIPIVIYAKNGKPLRKFIFMDDFDKSPVVKPLLARAEYSLLIFNCIGKEGKYYKVVIDEKKQQIGYIMTSDKKFRYESWSEHIVTLPTVDFDANENPLRSRPDGNASLVKAPQKVEFYYPKQVVGDWLKVVWDTPKKGVGWVKWKDKNNDLLIQRFYVM